MARVKRVFSRFSEMSAFVHTPSCASGGTLRVQLVAYAFQRAFVTV